MKKIQSNIIQKKKQRLLRMKENQRRAEKKKSPYYGMNEVEFKAVLDAVSPRFESLIRFIVIMTFLKIIPDGDEMIDALLETMENTEAAKLRQALDEVMDRLNIPLLDSRDPITQSELFEILRWVLSVNEPEERRLLLLQNEL